ncbi:MAG: hemolysin family protein [bacterium]|nr:hemolysin family protein [bacterium]
MNTVYLEVLFIVLLIIANGIFAMAEIAVISSRKSRLQQRSEAGDSSAGIALELASSPNHFLSTVQIGITLVGIFAGAYGGATISRQLIVLLDQIPWLAPYSGALGIALVVLAITYLSLVIGELVPKRLALSNPETIASAVAKPMRMLSRIAIPVVHLLSLSTEAVLRLIGTKPSEEPPVTEEEVRILITQGAQSGVFEEAEHAMLESIFRLGDRKVASLMVPRSEVDWLDADADIEDMWRRVEESRHSVLPVCEGALDNVIGMVNIRDLLIACRSDREPDIRALAESPVFVSENAAIPRALEIFKESKSVVALAVDEYGGIQGLISTDDVLQAIVGEITSAGGHEEPLVVKRSDDSWLLDGALSISDLKHMFNISKPLPNEEDGGYHTLGGFVMAYLGKIPSEGDRFQWDNFSIEVVDMDGYRVDKVLMRNTSTV